MTPPASGGTGGSDGTDGPDAVNGADQADEAASADAPAGPTIADLLDDLSGEFPDVDAQPDPSGADYLVGGQLFARQRGSTGEFRLRPEIAAAAAKTGDAALSGLGGEWIAFTPRVFDQYAVDRAQSWFELAHRLASAKPDPRSPRH